MPFGKDGTELVLVPRYALDWLAAHYPALCQKSGLRQMVPAVSLQLRRNDMVISIQSSHELTTDALEYLEAFFVFEQGVKAAELPEAESAASGSPTKAADE